MLARDLFVFIEKRNSRKLLFFTACLLVGCTLSTGDAPFLEIAFANNDDSPVFVRARTIEGDEFAVFVERNDKGEPIALQRLAILLADGTLVVVFADAFGRPVHFKAPNASVTIIYRTSNAIAVYIDSAGERHETSFSLPVAADPNHIAALNPPTTRAELLCDSLLASYNAMARTVFDCSDTIQPPRCSSVIATAARVSLILCTEEATIATDQQLVTQIETDPDAPALNVGFSVVAFASAQEETSQTLLFLDAVAFGGTAPYTLAWEIIEGPLNPPISEGPSTEVALLSSGTYLIEVTATDFDAQSIAETIEVDITVNDPGSPLTVNAGLDRTVTSGDGLVLEGSATGGDGDYVFEWSPTNGLSDPFEATPTLTLDTAGESIYTLTVTDGDGNVASDSTMITVVDALTASAGSDVVVQPEESTILEGSASSGDGNYVYAWTPTTGLSDSNVAEPTLTLQDAGAFTYTLTVRDGTGTEASDSMTAFVVEESLIAEAGSDISATVGATVTLQGSATGGLGDYVFSWAPETGLSDPTATQPILNTGDLGAGTFEYTVTVSDDTGLTATDAVMVTVTEGGGVGPGLTVISSIEWGADFAGAGYQILLEFNQTLNQSSAQTLTSYRTNGTATNPSSATLEVDLRTVTLVFSAPMASTDTIDVSVGGAIIDSFGGAISEKLNQPIATNATDTTAPTISTVTWADGYTSGGYQAIVTFDEAIDEASAETVGNYDVNNGANDTPGTASLGNDGKTVTLTWGPGDLTNPLIPSDTIDVSIGGTITDINTQTLAAQPAQAVAANGADVTAPTINSISWANGYTTDGYQAIVTFSESVDETTAESVGNYDVNNGGNDNPGTAVLATDGKTVTLTWATGDLTNPLDGGDTFDISLGNTITDMNAQALTAQTGQAVTAIGSDVTAPTISSIVWANGYTTGGYQAVVTFNESMDESTAETVGNYDVNNGANDSPGTAVLAANGKTVTLTWATGDLTNPLDGSDTVDISLGNTITDINAQSLAAQTGQAVTASGADATAPTISSVTWADGFATGGYQAVVAFNESMDESTAETVGNYDVNNGANDAPGSAMLASDGKTVTLTWATGDLTNPLDGSDTVDISLGNSITDINAQSLTAQAGQAVSANGSDAAAPTISTITWANGYTTDGYQATVTFNESIDESTAETVGNYDVNNGANDTPGTAVLASDGKTVTLTWATGNLTNPLDGSDTFDISLGNTITDINAQALAVQAAQAVTASGSDATAPTISSVIYGREKTNYMAIVTFNESLDESTAEATANYDVNNGDNANPNTAVLATDGKTVTLTWTTAELTQPWAIADTIDISIGSSVTDINARALATAAGTAVSANGADAAGPADPLRGHVALSTDVTLVFDEVMDEATCEVNTYATTGALTQVGNAVLSNNGRTVTVTFTADPTTLSIIVPNTLLDINGNAYAGGTLGIPN